MKKIVKTTMKLLNCVIYPHIIKCTKRDADYIYLFRKLQI